MHGPGVLEPSSEPQKAPGATAARGMGTSAKWWRWVAVNHGDWSTAVLACLVIIALAVGLSTSLRDWAVGLGMDAERGALIASLLIVIIGAATTTLLRRRPNAVRFGAVVAMVIIEVVPFLTRAGSAGPTPGLTARVDVAGWVLQPLGMFLLGFLAACIGAGVGLLLRRDLARLWSWLRLHRRAWLGVVPAVAVLVVATPPAVTALQTGPTSALYTYGVAPQATTVAGGTTGSGHTTPPSMAAAPFVPGHLEEMIVAGHRVVVDVPGAYTTQARRSFPVLYVLHGYPSNPDATIAGLQLTSVIDQLVASHRLPATLIVIPDGNGRVTADAEWGDTANGNRIETWLVSQVVPAIDAGYRTQGAGFRAIAGYSSGGFGAVNLALRHPDLFRSVASWSGFFTARADLFGAQTGANSPAQTAPHLPGLQRMPIYLGVGNHDGYYLDQTRRIDAELRSLNWPAVRLEVVAGGHSAESWRAQLVSSLSWLGVLWSSAVHPHPHPGARVVSSHG